MFVCCEDVRVRPRHQNKCWQICFNFTLSWQLWRREEVPIQNSWRNKHLESHQILMGGELRDHFLTLSIEKMDLSSVL